MYLWGGALSLFGASGESVGDLREARHSQRQLTGLEQGVSFASTTSTFAKANQGFSARDDFPFGLGTQRATTRERHAAELVATTSSRLPHRHVQQDDVALVLACASSGLSDVPDCASPSTSSTFPQNSGESFSVDTDVADQREPWSFGGALRGPRRAVARARRTIAPRRSEGQSHRCRPRPRCSDSNARGLGDESPCLPQQGPTSAGTARRRFEPRIAPTSAALVKGRSRA